MNIQVSWSVNHKTQKEGTLDGLMKLKQPKILLLTTAQWTTTQIFAKKSDERMYSVRLA